MERRAPPRAPAPWIALVATAVAVAVTVPSAARAADAERWTALSRTAMGITGDVAFTSGRLTFADGEVVHVRRARTVRATTWTGLPTHGSAVTLFRIVRYANGPLRAGNRLCATQPTFLSIVRGRAPSRDVVLAVFSGAAPPRGDDRDALCGTFTYEIAAGP